MAILTPLGLLASGHAFGEGSRGTGFWHHALFNGYDFSHDKHPAVGYIVSAGFGVLAIGAVILAVFAVLRLSKRSLGRASA
jgi:hypothetical protein